MKDRLYVDDSGKMVKLKGIYETRLDLHHLTREMYFEYRDLLQGEEFEGIEHALEGYEERYGGLLVEYEL